MAVVRLGIFEVFDEQKMSATELAAKTGADHLLVGKAESLATWEDIRPKILL